MIAFRKLISASAGTLSLVLFTTGCNLSQFSAPSTATSTLPTISGHVHGAQQPVANSTIQLYAANTTTLRGASTPLLTTTVTTNSAGNFTITGDYTCPTPNTLVYIVATGGNPGLPGSANNTGLALMAALGTCGSLTSSTFISINELTTVASVQALAPFMTDFAHIGADTSNPTGLTGAFATATSFVNFSTGAFRTSFPAGVTPPVTTIDSVADIIASCVNSAGGVAGDGTTCGRLFLNTTVGTTAPTNTGAALLNIVQNPTNNAASLYALIPAASPFQPVLTSAPTSFAAASSSALPNTSPYFADVAIDSAQHVWAYISPIGSGNGELLVFDNNGSLLYTLPDGSGGLGHAIQIQPDPFGNVWALNSDHTLSKFGPTGTALSPATGFPTIFISIAGSTGFTTKMAIDSSGNVWITGLSTSLGVTNCYAEYSNVGVLITPSGAYCPVEGQYGMNPASISLDQSGNLYFNGAYATFNTSTSYVFKVSNLGAQISPLPGYFGGSFTTGTGFLRYDRAYNQLWGWDIVTGSGTFEAMAQDGTMISPAIGGFPIPSLIPITIEGAALDGAGNMWYSALLSLTGSINAMDHLGHPITPTGTTTSPNVGISIPGMMGPTSMAVDAYGNIWVTDIEAHLLFKIPGLAVPKNYQ